MTVKAKIVVAFGRGRELRLEVGNFGASEVGGKVLFLDLDGS